MNVLAHMVAQFIGTSRIPESAKPIGVSSLKPERRPAKPPSTINEELIAKLESALSARYESVRTLGQRAGVGYHTALFLLPIMARRGQSVGRDVPWRVGTRREYRRAR